MAGPGSERAAGGGGGLRASRADREQVVEVLKAAFVEGRLDRDEFGLRAGRALVSRTCAELAGLTADIPVRLVWARPRGPGRESVSKVAVVAAAGATGVLGGLWPVMLLAPPWPPFVLPVAVVWFVLVMAVPAGWVALLHDWHRKRASRQAVQGPPPGAGGAASQRPAPAAPARQLPQSGHDPRHTAKARQSSLPRPQVPGVRRPRRGNPLGRRYALGCPPSVPQP